MAKAHKTVVAIGKFDGVHIGHQRLLKKASEISKESNIKSTALIIETPGQKLVTASYRSKLIKSCGIDDITLQNLTPDFMNMSAEEFVFEFLLQKLSCAHVVVGYNFKFAKGRSATADDLKGICEQNGIGCTIVSEVTVSINDNNVTAGSTKIRELLLCGDVESASKILGRAYSLSGIVAHGKEIGRTINFPTANLSVTSDIILPKCGVYATKVKLGDKEYNSITNIGANPTVNADNKITVETHIIDFSGDIYEKKITVEFIKKIRDEKKFDSLEELKHQIQKDIEFALLTK